MKIVIDSNRIAAALLKDSTTRGILFDTNFNFIAPEFVKEEIKKHQQENRQSWNKKENLICCLL